MNFSRAVRVFAFTCCMLLPAAACGPRDVVVAVSVPNEDGVETPLPGVRLVLMPYDRDSVLAALESRATSARPSGARLDSLYAEFRTPFNEYLGLAYAIDRARRAVESATDSTTRRRLEDSVQALSRRLEQARGALDLVRGRVEPAIDSERTRIRVWEDSAFRQYDSVGQALASSLHRDPIVDSTRSSGTTTVRLRAGNWWVIARAVNVSDPNAEWYWNVKVQGDTVRLNPGNGRLRPRI